MKKVRLLALVATLAFALNFLVPGLVFGQGTETPTATQEVGTGGLSFYDTPDSFPFSAVNITNLTASNVTNYSNTSVLPYLPLNKRLSVDDLRNEGGFRVYVGASSFTATGTGNILPLASLRMVSYHSVAGVACAPSGGVNGVCYETGSTGSQEIVAPVITTSTLFGTHSTFSTLSGNQLNAVIDLMQGTLPTSTGRTGRFTMGNAFNLVLNYVGAASNPTQPGTYITTLTYSLVDQTT